MLKHVLQNHLARFRKHIGWMLLSVSGQLAVRMLVPRPALEGATDVAGNFLQTFGGMYGVIVAFAIYVVWQEHNETQVTIEREAVSLSELFRVLGFMKGWLAREHTRALLLQYAQVVPLVHGPELQQNEHKERVLLDHAFGDYLAYAPTQEHERRLYESGLDLFRQLNEAREHRETVANLRLPEALRWFVYLGGAFTVCTLWLVWVDTEWVQALFTAGMTWVVVAGASIVTDLDDPYTGDFVVNWRRFHDVAKHMESFPCPPLDEDHPPRSLELLK